MKWLENLFLFLNGTRIFKITITKKVYIYGIRGLNRKSYFYVGKTSRALESRIYAHLDDSLKKKHKNKCLEDTIRKYRFLVTFDILEICNENESSYREKYWIDEMKRRKYKLCNIRNPENPFKNLN